MSQLTFPNVLTCEYIGCANPVCESNLKYLPPSKRYCQAHSDEIDGLFKENDPRKIIDWKILAQGKKR